MRDAIVARDATIRELTPALEESVGQTCRIDRSEPAAARDAGWAALVANLRSRPTRSESRRERIENQLAAARSASSAERAVRAAAEQREIELRREVEALEASLALGGAPEPPEDP